jgi:hypothetical protein
MDDNIERIYIQVGQQNAAQHETGAEPFQNSQLGHGFSFYGARAPN